MIRKLITSDLFKMSRVIKKMDIKEEIEGLSKSIFEKVNKAFTTKEKESIVSTAEKAKGEPLTAEEKDQAIASAISVKEDQILKIDLALLFVENIGNAEQECYKFLADLSGKKPEEIEKQPPEDTINMLDELFQQEGFGSFFSTAVKSTQ